MYDGLSWHAPIRHVGNFPVTALYRKPIPALGLFFKRLFDVTLSALFLIVSSPFLGIIAVWIKMDSPDLFFTGPDALGKRSHFYLLQASHSGRKS
jgi:lipopolysaccharide/colanic/teichoic acid biosynthesis glycosyltransferase